jgi:methionyl-tRNA formyltransferase
MKTLRYAFFGTGPLAESVLKALYDAGYVPDLVVTKPDAPQGRHMHIQAPHIKTWCEMNNISTFQPESLKELGNDSPLHEEKYDVFIVASYGKIIPDELLALPTHGVLNVHPSLLPEYRGASPIESALLDGKLTTGVSIIKLDNEMDHGPILVQSAFAIPAAATSGTLEVECGLLGGTLLLQVLESYIAGNLTPKEQDHSRATLCKKIEKELGEIKLTDQASDIQRKYRALTPWPGLYFFIKHDSKTIRVKVNEVELSGNYSLANECILKVTPEGKHQISWEDFTRGYLQN